MIVNSDDETNFPHKLLLTNTQITNLRKAFANYLSADIKLTKTQLSKMQSGGFLNFLRPLTKIVLLFLKNLAKSLIKNVLAPLGSTTVMSSVDGSIQTKIHASSHNATLIISNDEMEDILKIVKSIKDSGLLLGVSETIKNKAKEQKGRFLSMLLGTLGASLLGNILAGKGIIRAGEGTVRVGSKRSSPKDL